MNQHSLQVDDLTVSYRRIPALHHVGFSVPCGSCVAVLGPNGAGKSTLLKALAGLLELETGSVSFHGRQMRGASREFAYLPQREMVAGLAYWRSKVSHIIAQWGCRRIRSPLGSVNSLLSSMTEFIFSTHTASTSPS